MKYLICLNLILMASASEVLAQKTFDVQDFSKDFYGKVYLENPAEVFTKGSVSIYSKKTNKRLIKVDAEELAANFAEGKVKANVRELPYGEQSVIVYEDFNFDGVKDLAIMDGQNSCYHGPSFQIFLAAKGSFVRNPSFTRLAQEYCGMFDVDQKEKKISTMTKSGCCWHQYSEFVVVGNKPKAVKIVEEDATGYPILASSTETWNGTKMVESFARTVDLEDSDSKVLLSFKMLNNDNEVILFASGDQFNYVFIDKTGNIELAFPLDSKAEDPRFTVDSKNEPTRISFSNKGVIYSIYESGDEKIGILIDVNGKLTDIPGDLKTRNGTLRGLADQNLSNVTFSR